MWSVNWELMVQELCIGQILDSLCVFVSGCKVQDGFGPVAFL